MTVSTSVDDAPTSRTPDVLDELSWRGLVAQTTDADALREALANGPLTLYCGFDPTAPSLHFGNLVQLIVLRHLQRAGHRVLCLVGGSTGLIGDPRPTAERVLKSKETTAQWVAGIAEQVRPFLVMDGENPATVVNNLDWTAPLSAIDFLRDIGKHFRVNTMIRKEAVAARLNSQDGISYTEFSYQILQGLDYLHLYREFGCTLQTGGIDQWGNLTAGVDLIHRAEGASVHVLTTPLITTADGTKFGKSEGNAVWLSAEMTSPYAFYQYWLNVEDASVLSYLRIFTDRSAQEIGEIEESFAARPHLRLAQRTLAADVTTLVHGAPASAAAQAASEALFGRASVGELDARTLLDATDALPGADLGPGVEAVDAFVAAGLVESRNAARRVIAEGGAFVNNERITAVDAVLAQEDFLHGRVALLRRGRKALAAARWGAASTAGSAGRESAAPPAAR